MDSADITALNDFNEEIIARARGNVANQKAVPRGVCLYCAEAISAKLIYCDEDCQKDYEATERVKRRTHK